MVISMSFISLEEVIVVLVVLEAITDLFLLGFVASGSDFGRLFLILPVVICLLVVKIARCVSSVSKNESIVLLALVLV